jgi:hypothetical protein
MGFQQNDPSFSQSDLGSPAYRKRLLRKLNTLIAVLEVACAKVHRSLQGSTPDIERLTRIEKNLRNTLSVCQRAKGALHRHEQLPADLPSMLGMSETEQLIEAESTAATSEVTADKGEKLSNLGPITKDEIRSVDLDDLCDRLTG